MKSSTSQPTALWKDHSYAIYKSIVDVESEQPSFPHQSMLEILSQLLAHLERSQQKAIIILDQTADAVDLDLALTLWDQPIQHQLILPHYDHSIQATTNLLITTLPMLIIGNENQSERWHDYDLLLFNPLPSSHYDRGLILKRFFGERFQHQCLIPLIEQSITQSQPLTKASKQIKSTEKRDQITSKNSAEGAKASEKRSGRVISLNDRKSVQESPPLEKINFALLQGNFKRQYIRDQVRNNRLKGVIVITDNHQEARQLQNYLYRGRIRTKTIHNRTPDNIEAQIIEEFNSNRLTVLVILDEKIPVIENRLDNIERLYLYDLPTIYIDLLSLLNHTAATLNPNMQIALATENQRAWVDQLALEAPTYQVEIEEVENLQQRRRSNHSRNRPPQNQNRSRQNSAPRNAQKAEESSASNRHEAHDAKASGGEETKENPRRNDHRPAAQARKSQRNSNNNQRQRNPNQRQARQQRNHPRSAQANQSRNHEAQPGNYQPHADQHGNQADGQSNIVNRNRLPFEANSFEANIAKLNKRRGRVAFSGDPNRNFAQELQDHHQRGNNRPRNQRRNQNVDGNR